MTEGPSVAAFIAFFIGIVVLAIITTGPEGERKPLFSFDAGDREETAPPTEPRSASISADQRPARETTQRVDPREAERALDRAYNELRELEEEARTLKIWGTRSPYEDRVTLRRGNVRTEDVEREYLILQASSQNERPIDITNWTVESTVTERVRWIEPGVRTYRRGRVNEGTSIWLEPGERAYLISGESPVGISFHENQCTGYLREHQDFFPRLARSCPSPTDELEKFGAVDLDNDACYEFIERVGRCEIPDEDLVEDANLSNACEAFIVDYLSYNACVDHHRFEPFFDEGEWYIYLKREEDLWREEREIIRLRDAQKRTVDVVEY